MPAKRAFPWGWTAACAAIALVFFGLGWWAGRERLVYEMRDAFSKAFQAPDFGSAASETARKTIKVTVNQVSVSPTLLMTSRYSFRSGPSAETPSETGHVWMRCRVTVVNGGSQRVSIEPDDFELVGLNRNVYRAVDHSDRSVPDVNFLTATLLPGGTASGDLLFSIPPGVNPERVECTAD